jgi:hypothetical protein
MTTIDLTPQHFEVAFQVSHQAANFPEPRLADLGVSLAELDGLLALLGSVRKQVSEAGGVRIRFSDGDALEAGIGSETGVRSGAERPVLVVFVPLGWESRWRRVMELAASGLSEREMFLRTGYKSEEVAETLDRF